MQQHSNTYISSGGEWEKWVKEAFKIVMKSVFWIFLGGLIPMLAGGFIKRYWISLVVTTASALAMQCGRTTLFCGFQGFDSGFRTWFENIRYCGFQGSDSGFRTWFESPYFKLESIRPFSCITDMTDPPALRVCLSVSDSDPCSTTLLHGNAGKRGVFPNSTLATALEALVKLSSTLIGVKVTRPLPDLRNLCLCVTAICTFQKSYPRRPPLAIYPTSNTITSVKFKNASQTLGLLPSFIPSCSSNLIFSVKIPFSDVVNGSQQILLASILRHHQISYFTVLGSAPSPRNCYVLEANRLLPLWSFGMTR
ncbi:hypothetical protein YC2023_107787 [Brassica napus]